MSDNNRSYSSVKTPLVIHCLMVKIKSTFGKKVTFQKFVSQIVFQGHRISAACCVVHQNGEIGTEKSVRLNARGCNYHLRNRRRAFENGTSLNYLSHSVTRKPIWWTTAVPGQLKINPQPTNVDAIVLSRGGARVMLSQGGGWHDAIGLRVCHHRGCRADSQCPWSPSRQAGN